MSDETLLSNPYNAPQAPIEGQPSARGRVTGWVVMDTIGGIFWTIVGGFSLSAGFNYVDMGPRYFGMGDGLFFTAMPLLVAGLFLLFRAARAMKPSRRT